MTISKDPIELKLKLNKAIEDNIILLRSKDCTPEALKDSQKEIFRLFELLSKTSLTQTVDPKLLESLRLFVEKKPEGK